MDMITESVDYQFDNVNMRGYLAYTHDSRAKRPAVLIAHAWKGQDDFAREKAHAVAELGYVGFSADLYGDGITAADNEEAFKLMLPLFLDRQLLRNRINAALEAVVEHPQVDSDAIAAIGFCFGGLTVIELLRSGAPVRGVVSFHGLLGYKLGEHTAKKVPSSPLASSSLLILHGHMDPLESEEDVKEIQQEFTKANVDWQMVIYGDAYHAFTNPMANDKKGGLLYNQRAAFRSWAAMCNFFDEIF